MTSYRETLERIASGAVGNSSTGKAALAEIRREARDALAAFEPLRKPEKFRQSILAQFDRCPLSARFALETGLRQPGVLAARGTLAHRFFAAGLNEMRSAGERSLPVEVGMDVLKRVLAQRELPVDFSEAPTGWVPLPAGDFVHVPVEEIKWLRVLATKFCHQHSYNVQNVVAVERRLFAPIEVYGEDGASYERIVSGQLDVLMAAPPDGAIVVDYKTGWSPAPEQRRGEPEDGVREDRLSDLGYAQQTIYGYLILVNYPAVEWVALREFYVMSGEVREARIERWQMERISDMLATLVSNLDAAIEEPERFFPTPGTHCSLCPRPRDCPVRDEIGIPADYDEAVYLVGEWHQAGEMRKERTPLVRGQVDRFGEVELPNSKGRKVVGYDPGTRRLKIYEPAGADESPFDALLEGAAREGGTVVG